MDLLRYRDYYSYTIAVILLANELQRDADLYAFTDADGTQIVVTFDGIASKPNDGGVVRLQVIEVNLEQPQNAD